MIGWLLGEFGGYILAALASIGGVVAVWFSGRSSGKAKAERDALERRVETAQEAREIDDEVSKSGDDAVRDELDQWMRKGD